MFAVSYTHLLKKEEGGRHTPFHNKYRPQFYLRTMDCTGEITLPEGTEMVMPGDNVTITVELIYPVALNPGLRFAIREGGRTVGEQLSNQFAVGLARMSRTIRERMNVRDLSLIHI